MTEIIMLTVLCAKIRKTAHQRKRKATWFIVLTIVLWIVFEAIFAFIINFVMLPRFEFIERIYRFFPFFIFLGGLAGGGIAYLIVKNCTVGTYIAPVKPVIYNSAGQATVEGVTELAAPCEIKVVRDKSFTGWAVSYTLFLNGEMIKLRNGEEIIKKTSVAQNAIRFETNYWKQSDDRPLFFTVTAGQPAEIHIKAGKFNPKKHKGVTLT